MAVVKDPLSEDDTLSLPLEIEGGYWDGTFRRILWIICLFIIILIMFAAYTPVREVARAQGEIIPVGSTITVEHLEGGIVDEVLVSEGVSVEKGDTLVLLREESGSGDFNELRVRLDLLELRRLRLVALLQNQDPDFGELEASYPQDTQDQRLLFNSEVAGIAAAERVFNARIKQRDADIAARFNELNAVNSQIAIFSERLASQRKLLQQGYSSRANLLQVKSQLEDVRAEAAQLNGSVESARAGILEIENEAVQAKNAKREEWSDQLLAAIAEMAELRERLTSSRDRVERLAIQAPRSGRVQSLAAKRAGEVIRPGDIVAEIVPLETSVEAEVRILPKDIGHVAVGFPTEVTISTFDPEIFGRIEGTLREISPTTFESQDGEKYYKGQISLTKNAVSHGDRTFPLSAGMIVTASVTTGSKSVLHYLLKPILRSYDRAFSER
ncbi:MAG: HlyD family type I secretion periplasmic adaptor subunit [Pseudomonadota bacterium]